jgi:hypothetical protein
MPRAERALHGLAHGQPFLGADTAVEATVRHDLDVAIREQQVDSTPLFASVSHTPRPQIPRARAGVAACRSRLRPARALPPPAKRISPPCVSSLAVMARSIASSCFDWQGSLEFATGSRTGDETAVATARPSPTARGAAAPETAPPHTEGRHRRNRRPRRNRHRIRQGNPSRCPLRRLYHPLPPPRGPPHAATEGQDEGDYAGKHRNTEDADQAARSGSQ